MDEKCKYCGRWTCILGGVCLTCGHCQECGGRGDECTCTNQKRKVKPKKISERTKCVRCERWGVIDGECRLCGHGHLKCRHCEEAIDPQLFEELVKGKMLAEALNEIEAHPVQFFCIHCSGWTIIFVDAVIEVAISKSRQNKPDLEYGIYKDYHVETWQDYHPDCPDCDGYATCWFAVAIKIPNREDDPGPELDFHAHSLADALAGIKHEIDERK